MPLRRTIYTFFFLLTLNSASAQDYNYIHYDTKDGLASLTVYSITQDKKGYLWFATDNGVCRFDGKKFTTFTTDNGLPDNEVLSVYSDSHDKVWCMTFNKSLGYIQDNKFYEIQTAKYIPKSILTSTVAFLGENRNGTVFFFTKSGIFAYLKSGELKVVADYNLLSKTLNTPITEFFGLNVTQQFPYSPCLFVGHNVYVISETGIKFLKKNKSTLIRDGVYNFYTINDDLEPQFPNSESLRNYFSLSVLFNQYRAYNTGNGSLVIDPTGNLTGTVYLEGKKVSNSFIDSEGNIWFATLGEGLYSLTSGSMKTFARNYEAFSLEKSGSRIFSGLVDGRLEIIKQKRLEGEYSPPAFPEESNARRLYTLKSIGDGKLLLGYDSHIEIWDNGQKKSGSALRPIKSIDLIDEKNAIICTNMAVYRIRLPELTVTDTLLTERGTKLLYDNGTTYIGTLSGIVIIDSNGKVTRSSEHTPLLSNRIVDLQKDDRENIWVATNDKGIIRYRNGNVEAILNTRSGLSSNGCKSLFLKNQYLWAGTSKGINKIDTRTNQVIARYSISDGLPSDIINDLYVDDSLVWVASPGGITFFSEKDISDSSICNLDLHTVQVSGQNRDADSILSLGYRDNNILFGYTAISFKSAGSITYHYKLTGLDNEWKETSLTTLSYPSLPPGNYTFQLYAINKFGKQSRMVTLTFSITAPFWKTIWFWLLLSMAAIWLTAWLISRRFRFLQQRTREKNELNRKIADLEQASLRAQMNPHFIFNCLNSIQHFIIKKDIENTNKYITQFGSLIRQTLDNSARTNITIADEIKYLASYLELEKMRFPEAFSYSITTDPSIQLDYTCVPSMILQPFVENAIRHGIRNKEKGVGLITINIRQNNEGIHFTVKDNGVGRAAAARLKSEQHIEYQSKGINLATNRLALLSQHSDGQVTIRITDLADEEGNAAGTSVDIFFPKAVIDKLN